MVFHTIRQPEASTDQGMISIPTYVYVWFMLKLLMSSGGFFRSLRIYDYVQDAKFL